MSCEILKNGKEILSCSSILFNTLFLSLLEVYKADSYFNNEEINSFMKYMEMYNYEGGSYWFDITKYIKQSQNVQILIEMLDKSMINFTMLSKISKEDILGFRYELIKYKSELEAISK